MLSSLFYRQAAVFISVAIQGVQSANLCNELSLKPLAVAQGPSQVDGRPPVLTATSQSNGNGQTFTTHRIQTP